MKQIDDFWKFMSEHKSTWKLIRTGSLGLIAFGIAEIANLGTPEALTLVAVLTAIQNYVKHNW